VLSGLLLCLVERIFKILESIAILNSCGNA
jgi:hypothetical protein